MQMLGTWLVAFQAIRLDCGRCFKGVHLSQVHQPRNIDVALAWLVQLRQLHPLKKTLRNRNKKAAGHVVMSCGYTLLHKVLSGGALVSSAPTEEY